jgi:hypothetical protein
MKTEVVNDKSMGKIKKRSIFFKLCKSWAASEYMAKAT